jgi:hypothetical protein
MGIGAGGADRAADDELPPTLRRPLPRTSEPITGTEYRGELGFARRGGKECDEGDDGEWNFGEERSTIRTPVQGDGIQRLSIGDAIPFPPLNERFPVDHGAASGGVCWKRGSREGARWVCDSSTSSDEGEYIPEGGGGAEREGTSDGDGEWDHTPWPFPPASPTVPPGFITVTLLGPDADWEAKLRCAVSVIAGRITARHV